MNKARTALVTAAVILLALGLASVVGAQIIGVDFSQNAGTVITRYGFNELGRVDFFSNQVPGTPNVEILKNHWGANSQIIRVKLIASDVTIDPDGSYNYSRVDPVIKAIVDAGAVPMICFAEQPGGWISNRWGVWCHRLLSHLLSLRDASGKRLYDMTGWYFEVMNEPDLISELLSTDYIYTFNTIYTYIKNAVPGAYVGGPVTSAFQYGWAEDLLRYAYNVDFLSWHQYGAASAPTEVTDEDLMDTVSNYGRDLDIAANRIAFWRPAVPLAVTEYNLNSYTGTPDAPETDARIKNQIGAAWACASLAQLLQSPNKNGASVALFREGTGDNGPPDEEGGFGMWYAQDATQRAPVFYAYSRWTSLFPTGGRIVQSYSDLADIVVLAGRTDDPTSSLMLVNTTPTATDVVLQLVQPGAVSQQFYTGTWYTVDAANPTGLLEPGKSITARQSVTLDGYAVKFLSITDPSELLLGPGLEFGGGLGGNPGVAKQWDSHDGLPHPATYQVDPERRAPTCALTFSPCNPVAGDQMLFEAHATAFGRTTITNVQWDWNGDGLYEEEGVAAARNHSYTVAGTYTVRIRVTDSNSPTLSGECVTTVTVRATAQQAAACCALTFSPLTPALGDEITFNSGAQAVAPSQIANIEWDWDGNGTYDEQGTELSRVHAYPAAGSYTVRVRVTDNGSPATQATCTTTVTVVAPSELLGAAMQRISPSKDTPGRVSQLTTVGSVTADHSYRVSGWVKTQNLFADAGSGATLSITFCDDTGAAVGAEQLAPLALSGSTPWKQLSVQATAPTGATRMRVALLATGVSGSAWFDEIHAADEGFVPPMPPTGGTIAGKVYDDGQHPLAGALVVTAPGGYYGVSAEDGSYRIEHVPVSDGEGQPAIPYLLTASMPGYQLASQSGVTLTEGGVTTADFILVQEPGMLVITETSSPETQVHSGQNGITVTMKVDNLSQRPVRIYDATLTFWEGLTNRSTDFMVQPDATNPKILAPASTGNVFAFTVAILDPVPGKTISIDGYVRGYENLLDNGSFEVADTDNERPNEPVGWTNLIYHPEAATDPYVQEDDYNQADYLQPWHAFLLDDSTAFEPITAVAPDKPKSFKLSLWEADPPCLTGNCPPAPFWLDLPWSPRPWWVTPQLVTVSTEVPVSGPLTSYRFGVTYKNELLLGKTQAGLVLDEYTVSGEEMTFIAEQSIDLPQASDWQRREGLHTTSTQSGSVLVLSFFVTGVKDLNTFSLWLDDAFIEQDLPLIDDSAGTAHQWTVTDQVASPLLDAGWNLISLPLEPANPDPTVVFAGVKVDGALYRYDMAKRSYMEYSAYEPGAFGGCHAGEGYWLYLDQPITISYQRARASVSQAPLNGSGWALIGNPSGHSEALTDCQVLTSTATQPLPQAAASGLISLPFFDYDVARGYQECGVEPWDADYALRPWKGYWAVGQGDVKSLVVSSP